VGEEITIEAFSLNDVDYGFTSWSGDKQSKSNKISFTAGENVSLTANFKWIGFTSIALGANVTASSTIAGATSWAPENLVDNITTPSSGSMGYSSDNLGSANPTTKPWIEIDLGTVKSFDSFKLYPRLNTYTVAGTTCNFPIDSNIQVRNTLSDAWVTVATCVGNAPYKNPLAIKLDNVISARYIRLNVNKITDHASDDSANRIRISEFGVYNTTIVELTSSVYAISEDGYISNVINGLTIDEFLDGFDTKGAVQITTPNGIPMTTGAIKTGMILKDSSDSSTIKTYQIAVIGDINGDGDTTVTDIVALRGLIIDNSGTTIQFLSANLVNDNYLTVSDIVALRGLIIAG